MNIIIDKNFDGRTVRDILTSELGFSGSMIKKLKFSDGGILVDGRFVTVRHVLSAGEALSLAVEDRPEDVSPYTIPAPLPLPVIFEDGEVTAVNKPPAMPAHPSHGHRLDTVSNALAYRYRDRNYVFRPVNRLDRDTSGCMLTANSKAASYKMYLAMTGGQIKKKYIAVTDGSFSALPPQGSLRSFIKRREDSIMERVEVDSLDPCGREAITEYEVLLDSGSHAVLMLSPITGRTHQIRVQLAGVGAPVTGDTLYGSPSEVIGRQALHSWRTEFPHPVSGERITVTAPLHDDMVLLIRTFFPNEAEALVRSLKNDCGGH